MLSFAPAHLVFFILNSFVFGTAILLVLRLQKFYVTDRVQFILRGALLVFLQIFLSQEILGFFGVLDFPALFLLNGIIFSLALLFYGKKAWQSSRFEDLSEPLKQIPLLALLIPLFFLLTLLHFQSFYQVPLDYDSVAYHLPFVAKWFQTGDLMEIYYSAFSGPIGYYPSNSELFDLWSVLVYRSDQFLPLLNLPVVLLIALALFGIGRRLECSQRNSLLGGLLFVLAPFCVNQFATPKVDLLFALFFVLAVYFLIEFWKSRSQLNLFFFALASGLFIGTKYLGLPYLLPLLFLGIVLAFYSFWNRKKQIATSAFLTFLGCSLGGGFWYLRNLLDSGNPIFPWEFSLFNWEGYLNFKERTSGYSILENLENTEQIGEVSLALLQGAGVQVFLIPLAVLGLLIMLFHKKIKGQDRMLSLLLLASLFYYFIYYLSAPFSYVHLFANVRYAMIFFVVLALSIVFIASRFPRWSLGLYIFGLSSVLLNLLFFISPSVLIEGSAFQVFLFPFLYIHFWKAFFFWLLWMCFLIIVIVFLFKWDWEWSRFHLTQLLFYLLVLWGGLGLLLSKTSDDRLALRPYFFDLWANGEVPSSYHSADLAAASLWLEENDPLASIAYTGFNFHYYFYGADLLREVDYININSCENCRYLDFKNEPDSIRTAPSFEAWVSHLMTAEKDYFVLTPTSEEIYPWEEEWIASHPEIFIEVFRRGEVVIYKITIPGEELE